MTAASPGRGRTSIVLLFAAACTGPRSAAPTEPSTEPVASEWTLDTSTFDRSVEPCDDFYQYVCGGWESSVEVARGSGTLERTKAAVDAATTEIYQAVLAGDGHEPDLVRLRTYYSACMRAPEADLGGWFARIDGGDPVPDLIRDLHRHGINVLFRYSGVPDPADPGAHRGQIQQGSLVGGATAEHVEGWLLRSGLADEVARDASNQLASLEQALGRHALPFEKNEFQSPDTEHEMTVAELEALVPSVDWASYFAMVGALPTKLNVKSPDYLKNLNRMVETTPQPIMRLYLRWKLMAAVGGRVPEPRAQSCRLSTLRALGVELSRQFALRAMDPSARDRANALASAVHLQATKAVEGNAWLTQSARDATAAKVTATDLKIGFPHSWPASGHFPLVPDRHWDNVLAAMRYEQRRKWERATRPQDRSSWELTVRPNEAWGMAAARLTIVNGYPDAFTNSIVLPAASLQPPMFDGAAPPEVNYATFGTLVGHELIHIVENYLFDGEGRARTIWTEADLATQQRQLACVIDEADAAGLDGDRTKEENVADLSGIRFAYEALAAELGEGLFQKSSDGFTAQQRFFVAYAQRWCTKMTSEYAAQSLERDFHAPPRFRVNAPLANTPEFGEAFSCSPPPKRCRVW